MVTYTNVRATDLAQPREKYRATWSRDRTATVKTVASFGLLRYNAVQAARTIVEAAPPRGAYVASTPAVSPEDETLVLDLRLATNWHGTAAALATMLNELTPSFSVVGLKRVDVESPGHPGESQDDGAADRARLQSAAEKEHDDTDLGSTLAKALHQLVLYAALAGGAFLVLSNLPTLIAAGKAVRRVRK